MTNYKFVKITGFVSAAVMVVLVAVQIIDFKQSSIAPIATVQDLVDTSTSALNSLPNHLLFTHDELDENQDDNQDEEFNDEQVVTQLAIPL